MIRTWEYKGYVGEYEVCIKTLTCKGRVLNVEECIIFYSPIRKDVQEVFERTVDTYLAKTNKIEE